MDASLQTLLNFDAPPRFAGSDYQHERDAPRLGAQIARVRLTGHVVRICRNCCREFIVSLGRFNEGQDKYCGRKCYYESQSLASPEKFWANTVVRENGCREWLGNPDKNGYGKLGVSGKTIMAHRYAYILTNGPIADGFQVCHKCDNPPCVNPDHLFLGTNLDNARDCREKGRSGGLRHRGGSNPMAKLTDEQMSEVASRFIGRQRGVQSNVAALAAEFGVTGHSIRRIAKTIRGGASR